MFNKIYNKVIQKLSRDINKNNEELYNRVFHYHRNRWNTVDNIADYLVGAEIDGDYAEFGVFQGTTFSYVYKIFSTLFINMRYFAFDSFSGLPDVKELDASEGYKSSFFAGQFECSEEEFVSILKKQKIDLSKIVTVKGWFNKTLNRELTKKHNITKFAAVWIDCDLYESTVPVLDFITDKIVTGTVIIFDDWRCYRNLPNFGEQRACREWLEKNPDIILHELLSFGFHGIAFTVEKK